MPDFGRPDLGRPDSGREPSFDEIRRTDSFIDALAGGRPVSPYDAADAELAALLGGWRDELRWPPATGLISEDDAIAALNAGRSAKRAGPSMERWGADTPNPRRHRRGLSVVGATAAAVLCIGGFGAVVAGSGPGDSLYGLRTMLFGDSKQVRDDNVGLAAKTELNQVQTLISQGDWEQAQNKLVAVSDQVASIGDKEQKQELLDQFNDLSAKVVERDPAATAPPGVVYTVPPSAAELVPAVAPSTSASTTTTGESTSPTTSSAPATSSSSESTTPATTSTSPTASATTSATTSAATPSTSATSAAESPAPSSTSVATSPAPASSSVTAQSETQQTTTPTSAAPSATTPAAPAPQSGTPAGPTTTPAAPPPPSTPAASTPAAPAPAAETAPSQPQPSVAVTTTVPVPVG